MDRELSIQEAAEQLNVSVPYLLRLPESGEVAARGEAPDIRVRSVDAREYKLRLDAEAERAFSELVQQAQELRMGYT